MNQDCAFDTTARCSVYCEHYGHTSYQCNHCTNVRCEHMSAPWLELADVHLLSESTLKPGHPPPDFEMRLPFEPTDAQRNKFSMFVYNAQNDTWRGLIDDAKAKGFTKFWVSGTMGRNITSFLQLPPWFDEMVEYIAAFNE